MHVVARRVRVGLDDVGVESVVAGRVRVGLDDVSVESGRAAQLASHLNPCRRSRGDKPDL